MLTLHGGFWSMSLQHSINAKHLNIVVATEIKQIKPGMLYFETMGMLCKVMNHLEMNHMLNDAI